MRANCDALSAGSFRWRFPECYQLPLRLELFFSELLDSYLDSRDTIRIIYREFEQLAPHGVDGVVGRLTQVNTVIATFVRQAIDESHYSSKPGTGSSAL